MIIDFIGALAAGLGLLGVALLVNRLLFRGRIGRWLYPASVAAGMVAYTGWAETTWGQRTIDSLPQLRLATEYGDTVFWRPWTYAFPQTTRMVAVDLSQTRTHPDLPGLVMTRVVLIGRWQPMRGVMVVFDCAANTRADLLDGVRINADGTLEGASWLPLEAGDPVLGTACAAVEGESDGNGSGT